MNLMFGMGRDFAEQLRPHARGWEITPLVCFEQCRLAHDNIFHYKIPPQNVSPWDFFYQNPPRAGTVNLKIRVPKHPIRIISLCYYEREGIVQLAYFRANGYAIRNDCPRLARFQNFMLKAGIDVSDDYEQMKVYRIWRVSKGNKKLRFETDWYRPTEPVISGEVLANAAAVIARSFRWIGRGRNEKFRNGEPHLGIDLNGRAHAICDRSIPHR